MAGAACVKLPMLLEGWRWCAHKAQLLGALAARVNSGPHTPVGNEDAIGRLFATNARLTLNKTMLGMCDISRMPRHGRGVAWQRGYSSGQLPCACQKV